MVLIFLFVVARLCHLFIFLKLHPFVILGRSSKTLKIDGTLPHETVPDSSSNIFISIEGAFCQTQRCNIVLMMCLTFSVLSSAGDGFGSSHAKNLLSPEKVNSLIQLPKGCLEQTTNRLVPTALALRYLDLSDQWFDLPPDARDTALENIKYGTYNTKMLQLASTF